MSNLATVISDESTILILCTLTQSVLQCDQWFHDGLKSFLSLFNTFRTKTAMIIIPLPCSFLFAQHLEWRIKTGADKK